MLDKTKNARKTYDKTLSQGGLRLAIAFTGVSFVGKSYETQLVGPLRGRAKVCFVNCWFS